MLILVPRTVAPEQFNEWTLSALHGCMLACLVAQALELETAQVQRNCVMRVRLSRGRCSALHPLGLPGLTTHEQHRVSLANEVYITIVHVLHCPFQHNCIVSLANPSRSLIWSVLATLAVQFAREHEVPA